MAGQWNKKKYRKRKGTACLWDVDKKHTLSEMCGEAENAILFIS